jgi:Tfp pilus assembly PilM family ATPase
MSELLARARGGASHAEPQPGPPAAPFWKRPIGLGRSTKPFSIGLSVSGNMLCFAVLRMPTATLDTARRFPMEPGQYPGEEGFPAFLRACLSAMGHTGAGADVWAVLRSADMDLNVLSVPKLSGAKLDAAVYWTLQKEKKFAEAEYVLDYVAMGPTADAKTPKLDALTCQGRRADVERLREGFRAADVPLAGITSIPSAFMRLYRRGTAPANFSLAANIHVEPDFSAIGLYTRDRLLFSRFIRSGAGSMADTLVDHFQALTRPKAPVLDDLELPLPGAQKPALMAPPPLAQAIDSAQAQALLRHVLLGAPKPDFATPAHLLSPEEMLDIIAPAIERLARQVERTLDYYASSQQIRCDALHLSGDIFASPAITQALAGQLGFQPVVFDAAAMVPGGELCPAGDRMSMGPAIAAALSPPGKGINLLDNYKIRTAQEAKRTVTRTLLLGLAGLMLLIGGAGMVLERANAGKRALLATITAQQGACGPSMTDATLTANVNLFKIRQDALRETATRDLAAAALVEVGRLTPEDVRLVSFTVEYPLEDPKADKAGAPAKPKAEPAAPGGAKPANPATGGAVSLEGMVVGDRAQYDATLSRFVLALQSSQLFNMPVVNESGLRELGSGTQVLYFNMRLGVK